MSPRVLPRIVRRVILHSAVCVYLVVFPVQPAVADELDTLNFTLTDTIIYDANVFKTPDSAPPQTGFTSKGDYSNVISAGLRFNKPYAQQRFQFDVNKSMTRYDTFSFLDTEALNYRAAWLWALTQHLTGTLSADRNQSQVPFAQTGGTQRNVQTTNNRNFNLDGWVGGAWHLLAGVGQSDSTTDVQLIGQPSTQSNRYETGLRYVARSGNSVTFTQRYIPADLSNQPLDPVNLIDNKYRDTESDLRVNWKASGHSSFDGGITRKERRNANFVQRDFTGTAFDLRYVWTPTGKLDFNLVASRNISPYVAFGNVIQNSSFKVDRILSLGSVWRMDAKFVATLNLSRTLSESGGPVFATTAPPQQDDIRTARLGLSWIPTRNLSLNASLQRDRRTSNVAMFEFSDTMATLSASLNF